MNFKRVIFISILLFVLSVAAVSAADLDNNYVTELVEADDSFDSIEIQDSKILGDSAATFDDLQREINNAPSGSVLNLTRDYNGHEGAVVHLDKDLTIDGQGHTLNCMGVDSCSAFTSNNGFITLKNLKIINGYNNDNYNGGAIHIEGSAQYTIENCIFENNWADDNGGAIYNGANKQLRIINCQFKSNEADDDNGGAIYSSGELYIENSKFENNLANDNGGAIYTEHSITVNNSQFESNVADDDNGGAICSLGEVNVYNSTFYLNHAEEDDGGAIFSEANVNVYYGWFKGNFADGYGGAIFADNVYINGDLVNDTGYHTLIWNNGFSGETRLDLIYTEKGGAIYSKNNAYIRNAYFDFNNAYSGGSAIYAEGDVDIDKSEFDDNVLALLSGEGDDGGAIYTKGNAKISNSNFYRNGAEIVSDPPNGGAIYAVGDVNINDCMFQSNRADDGGAIYCEKSVNADNCRFDSNRATDSYGGAIYAVGDVNINDCMFQSNRADDGGEHKDIDIDTFWGGAIYCKGNVNININQEISDSYTSKFISSIAVDDGGAIYAEGSIKAVNTEFSYNEVLDYTDVVVSAKGGAIYSGSTTDLNHCLFAGNVMFGQGSAIYSSDILTVRNSKFWDNRWGGAIYAYCDAYISDCEFDRNSFYNNDGGAIHCCDNAYVTRCVFVANDAKDDNGGAIYCQDDLTVDNCYFRDNHAMDNGGAIYADTLTLKQTPSYFEGNWADNGQAGAIWVNKFNEDVKYAVFIRNHAGESGHWPDDGGAIYIDNGNQITFESCCFINNYCGDEGGAIYLDSISSELSLINNIFIGNAAAEGTTVFNCGKYATVKNNWWGEDFPEFDNVLVEWHAVGSNDNHYDADPLRTSLKVGSTHTNVNSAIPVEIKLFSAIDENISPELTYLENLTFSTNNNGIFKDYTSGQNTIEAVYTPKDIGTHQISIDILFNQGKASVAYLYVDADSTGPDGKEQVIENTDLSFTQFQTMVNNAPDGSVINLNSNVYYSKINDDIGIIINKNLVIDGHGHIFDAKSLSGIFQSSQGSITLKNIVFRNGNQVSADDGGAIRILGSAKYNIYNCTFDSNKALQDGGAIYNEGGNLELNDCTFVNNRCEGANKLNDCDGGAVHSKAPLLINHCDFRNNYAADNGGAIYATNGITWVSTPSNFVENTAYKGKGGAIYTNVFNNPVRFAVFFNNHAGEGALISDDGGAIYINNANTVTFSQCAFIINHCTDEGGAIYLDSIDSHLTLKNNYFLGNTAGDEGQVVFNCGHFDTVSDNWWADNLPSKNNDLLIQWEPLLLPNWHEVDSNPLYMKLKLTENICNVGNSVWATLCFYHYNSGSLCNGEMYTDLIGFLPNTNLEFYNRINHEYYVNILVRPLQPGLYDVTANLYGQFASATLSAYGSSQLVNIHDEPIPPLFDEDYTGIPDENNGNSGSTNVAKGNQVFNAVNDNISDLNHDVDNSTNSSSVSKAIDNPQTNSGDNNLWWIILAILAVLAAGGIIKKYKS